MLDAILLVEDIPAVNFYNEYLINKNNLARSINKVENGKIALDYILGRTPFQDRAKYPLPNVIFLDINMPVMGGFHFLVEFNKIRDTLPHPIEIIILTSSKFQLEVEKTHVNRKGIVEYLVKPLVEEELINVFKTHNILPL